MHYSRPRPREKRNDGFLSIDLRGPIYVGRLRPNPGNVIISIASLP